MMRVVKTIRTAAVWSPSLVLGIFLVLPAFGQQQSTPAQNKQQNSQTPPAKKTAAQENPFPEDVSKQAAQQQHQDQQNSAPAAPDAGQQPSGQKPADAAKDNPFPEDVSRSAAAADSSSSSSSSNSNPDGAGNPDADLPPDTGRRKLKKPSDSDIQSGSLAGEGKAHEDVRVGRFYLGTGNYKGAYDRFSEAARLDPANVDAIYGLAVAAGGIHRTQEALANYKLYLDIAPQGHDAKSARKAIQSLSK
jgi:tetratricopeptide (TPR) repeat protein